MEGGSKKAQKIQQRNATSFYGNEHKLVKKAKSFREDFRGLIKRRSSSNNSMSPLHSSKVRIGRNLANHTSLVDADESPAKRSAEENKKKLQIANNDVCRSLLYITGVIENKKWEVLPACASVTLELVIELLKVVIGMNNLNDCKRLEVYCNDLYRRLAEFIQWSDDMLITMHKELDKADAHKVVDSLSNSLTKLVKEAKEELNHNKLHNQLSPILAGNLSTNSDNATKRFSFPDSPLLSKHNDASTTTTKSQSSDDIFSSTQILNSVPPPKPPLPSDRIVTKSASFDGILNNEDMPPPLPHKSRMPSAIDSVTPWSINQSPEPNSDKVFHVTAFQQSHQVYMRSSSSHQRLISLPDGSQRHLSSDSLLSDPFDVSPLRHVTSLNQSPFSLSPQSSTSSGLNSSHDNIDGSALRFSCRDSRSSFDSNSSTLTKNQFNPLDKRTEYSSGFDNVDNAALLSKLDLSKCSRESLSESKQTIQKDILAKNERIAKLMEKINQISISVKPEPSEDETETAPALPEKQRPRLQSTYDNISPEILQQYASENSTITKATFKYEAITGSSIVSREEALSHIEAFSNMSSADGDIGPPLPPKTTMHVHTYMRTIGAYERPSTAEFTSRRSVNLLSQQWRSELFHPRSNTISIVSDHSSMESGYCSISSGSTDGPPSPRRILQDVQSNDGFIKLDRPLKYDLPEKTCSLVEQPISVSEYTDNGTLKRSSVPIKLDDSSPRILAITNHKDSDSDFSDVSLLDDEEVSDQLLFAKEKASAEHSIRGGSIDALIVHATTAAGKKNMCLQDASDDDYVYQEAFLSTYRTFITAKNLVDKLVYRYKKFCEDKKNNIANNTLSLLICVVHELAPQEATDEVSQPCMELVHKFVTGGELALARVLRSELIEKMEMRKRHLASDNIPLSSVPLSKVVPEVMHYKAQEIAEQMTLLDSQLFQTIEIPEILLWSKEQSEALSPNLTKFTIHFNNMSYWCRTKILMQEDAKDREKFLTKFIKIMRHLRKCNNFNSYLALLSAVDSAPIRRLDFSKSNLDSIKELSQLIDSSSSFRSYRRALADSEPPCIPYIGLILQDLTFIHIGNPDTFEDSSIINFAKRWQQFHVLDNMRRFGKCRYSIKKNEALIKAFDNFEDHHSEEVLWQISEKIKPRSTPKKARVSPK